MTMNKTEKKKNWKKGIEIGQLGEKGLLSETHICSKMWSDKDGSPTGSPTSGCFHVNIESTIGLKSSQWKLYSLHIKSLK